MVTNDLPSTTRAPELDDRNAVTVLKADADRWTSIDESAGEGINREAVGRFLRYLARDQVLAVADGSGQGTASHWGKYCAGTGAVGCWWAWGCGVRVKIVPFF